RLRIVPLLVVHVSLDKDRCALAQLTATSRQCDERDERGHGEIGRRRHRDRPSRSSIWVARARVNSPRVRSTSNLGSVTSIERKNLSSDAARKRSDSKTGWLCRGSRFKCNIPKTAPKAEERMVSSNKIGAIGGSAPGGLPPATK